MAKNYEIKTMQKDIEGLKKKLKMPGVETTEPLAQENKELKKSRADKISPLSLKAKKRIKKSKNKLIVLIIFIIIILLIVGGFYYLWS